MRILFLLYSIIIFVFNHIVKNHKDIEYYVVLIRYCILSMTAKKSKPVIYLNI